MYYNSYKSKTVEQRKEFIKSQRLCFNCFGRHYIDKCSSTRRCNYCRKKHHSSLHVKPDALQVKIEPSKVVNTVRAEIHNEDSSSEILESIDNNFVNAHMLKVSNEVLLSTAIVKAADFVGNEYYVRALIDQGSQVSFISENLFQKLSLKYDKTRLPISVVGGKIIGSCKRLVTLIIKPRFQSRYSIIVEAYVIPKVTAYRPIVSNTSHLPHIKNFLLADPTFWKTMKIDILLGASVHAQIIKDGIIKGCSINEPIATNTELGWILSGNSASSGSFCSLTVMHIGSRIDSMLERFWQQEEVFDSNKILTPEELQAEDYFINTHYRNKDGRYVVRLPFKDSVELNSFPGSYCLANRMLLRMEIRFESDPVSSALS